MVSVGLFGYMARAGIKKGLPINRDDEITDPHAWTSLSCIFGRLVKIPFQTFPTKLNKLH